MTWTEMIIWISEKLQKVLNQTIGKKYKYIPKFGYTLTEVPFSVHLCATDEIDII